MPRVSIIVPVYGTEALVGRCLDSLAAQTFRDFEVIVVDDCSPDDAVARVLERQSTVPGLRLERHEVNLGLAAARNTGIRAAEGEFVGFVDSDDWVDPDFIETLMAPIVAGADDIDLVAAGFRAVTSGGVVSYTHTPTKRDFGDPRDDLRNDKAQVDIFRLTNPACWNKLFRRTMFEEHDIWFPPRLLFEDLATTPRLVAMARRVVRVKDIAYNYVLHEGTITRASSEKHIVDHMKVFSVLRRFLDEHGLYERHRISFDDAVGRAFGFHGRNVLRSATDAEAVRDYLEILVMAKNGVLLTDPQARELPVEDIVEHVLQQGHVDAKLGEARRGVVRNATYSRLSVAWRRLRRRLRRR